MGKISPDTESRVVSDKVKARAKAELSAIQNDLALLPEATTAQTKQIIGRMLKRQAALIRFIASR